MQDRMENKVYAGFFVRLVAFAIDSVIAALVVGIIKFPLSIAAMSGVQFLKANFIFDYSLLDVLGYLGVSAYFVLLTYFTHATPGKMLMRLQVVTKSGEWTFLNVLYRETIGRFLSSLLSIGYLAVLLQPNKQGFHDMLCDTFVVYKNMCNDEPQKQFVPATASAPAPVPQGMQSVQSNMVQEKVMQQASTSDIRVSEVEPPVYYHMPVQPMNQTSSFDGMNPDSSNLTDLNK